MPGAVLGTAVSSNQGRQVPALTELTFLPKANT